jgi:FixJ family two-component response regulator
MSTDSGPPPRRETTARSAYVLARDPTIAALLVTVLGTFGFSPRKFTAPGPFFDEIDPAGTGLVVLDLAFGRSEAIEIIRRLAALKHRGAVLPIGGYDEAALAEVTALGECDGMAMLPPLRKPFRASEVKARVVWPSNG